MKTAETNTSLAPQRLHIRRCGIVPFVDTLKLQHQLVDRRRQNLIPDTVLILQHCPVITLGARKSANKLLEPAESLKQKNIDLVQIRRGGGATAHNPGQLVFYPVLNLRQLGLGVSDYVRKLEHIGRSLLSQLGVQTDTRKGYPGLWLGNRKIASIGVRVSRFITHHGMAININNDLSIFDCILPCGLSNITITSVYEQIGEEIDMDRAELILSKLLKQHLQLWESGDHENCA